MPAADYLTVASILSGFCVSVFVSRIQREVAIMDEVEKEARTHTANNDAKAVEIPKNKNWLAWADYLIVVSIMLTLLLVVLPLMAAPKAGCELLPLAAASCSAAAVLIAAYPIAILDHYRILWGKERKKARKSGEPLEKFIVIVALVIAAVIWCGVIAR